MTPQAMSTAGSGCPHDVRQRVIRRQGGRLPRRTVQCVRVRLGASDTPCRETAWLKIRDSSIIAPVNLSRCPQRRSVAMRCQLLHRERGLADSAGQTDVPLEKPTTGGCYVVRTDAARDAENHRGRDPGRSQKNQDTPRHTAGGWSRSRTPVPLALPDAFSFSHIQPLWRFPCPLSLLSPPII